MSFRPIVIIPARMASTRLPGKPLADIHGKPMIVHVFERAKEADVGDVLVACDDDKVMDAVTAHGGKAVMTKISHPSGSDRIYEALCKTDSDGKYDVVINVQGDLPTIEPDSIRASLEPLKDKSVDISTLTALIVRDAEKTDPNIVKIAVAFPQGEKTARALYFSRSTIPANDGPLYHHIGLYGYRRAALDRFVGLPPSILEKREKLEQLRALENGMRIDVRLVDAVPLGVDNQHELDRAREMLKGWKK